jgi:hypothetical protein
LLIPNGNHVTEIKIPEGHEDPYTNELILIYEKELKENIAPKISYILYEKPGSEIAESLAILVYGWK